MVYSRNGRRMDGKDCRSVTERKDVCYNSKPVPGSCSGQTILMSVDFFVSSIDLSV